MSAVETLTVLMRGDHPTAGLLHTCRLEGCGGESYGVEAIVENFRVLPMAEGADQLVFEDDTHMAVFDGEDAVFADVIEGNIARLWRLGSDDFLTLEPGISVSFDPDLVQERRGFFFDAALHPTLSDDAVEKLTTIGQELARDDGAYRTRIYALRAFGSADRGAALFAVYRLDGDGARTSGFTHAAVAWGASETHVVHDLAGQAALSIQPWTPHVQA
jgi:hypothetical protein